MSETTCVCGKPTSGAWLCDGCCKTLAIALVNVAAYYDDLTTVQTKATRYGSSVATRGSIGKSQPLPVDGRFLDVTGDGTQARWDVWNSVATWCRVVMEEAGPPLTEPACRSCMHTSCTAIRRRRWPRNTLRSQMAYFDRQFRWIIRNEWAPEFLDEMLDNERRLRRLIDRPADRWYAGKCSIGNDEDHCTAELYALEGAASIVCPGCEYVHDVGTRRDFLLDEARAYLVTATEAARALISWTDYDGIESNLVKRIDKWRDRERLEVADVTSLNGRDRHLYRLGDIQDLLDIDAARHEQKRHLETVEAVR
jgi:hypothetical protein